MGGNDLFCGNNPRLIERHIIDFIISLKEKGLGYSTIRNYVVTITSFYKINDIVLNTTKIGKIMPEYKKVKKDRGYTHEEIHKLLQIADERMGVVILLLSSSGIRIGALTTLILRNLDLENRKVTVYENTKEEYVTFLTEECKKAIDLYIDMRKRYGENITGDSFLIREQFDVRATFTKPRCISETAIQIKLIDLAKRAGVRTKNVPIAHGFRKFFIKQLIDSKLNPEIREMLLGHKIGLASAYYKPSEDEIQAQYLVAVNNLTINEENRLKIKVEKLEVEKSRIDILALKIEALEKRRMK